MSNRDKTFFTSMYISYFWPQGHVAGKPFDSFSCLNSIASLNSVLFKEKSYCSRGIALSQDDVSG